MRPLCPTRWTLNDVAVSRFLHCYNSICNTLEFVGNDKTERGEARAIANGLLEKMEEFDFYYFLNVLSQILNIMDSVNTKLQKVGTSITEAQNLTDFMRKSLQNLKNKFTLNWKQYISEANALNLQPPRLPRGRRTTIANHDRTPSDIDLEEHYISYITDIFGKVDSIIEERSQGAFLENLVQIDVKLISDTIAWDQGNWNEDNIRKDMNSYDIIQYLWPKDINIRRLLRQLMTLIDYFKSQDAKLKLHTFTELITLLKTHTAA